MNTKIFKRAACSLLGATLSMLSLMPQSAQAWVLPAGADHFVVDTASDDPDKDINNIKCETVTGKCSLRAAIMQANAFGVGQIRFASNVAMIKPQSALPVITAKIDIDGKRDLNGQIHLGPILTHINAINVSSGPTLVIKGNNSKVKNMRISSSPANAADLEVGFGTGMDIRDNWLGMVKGNCVESVDVFRQGGYGVRVLGAVFAWQGQPSVVIENNVIGCHKEAGIHIHGSDVQVIGNSIGAYTSPINPNAAANVVPNNHGVQVVGPNVPNTLIRNNWIAGNKNAGVLFTDAVFAAKIKGNVIGTTSAGDAVLANGAVGVHIIGGGDNVIGGLTIEDRNLISGNGVSGIYLQHSVYNSILGNYIGVDRFGQQKLGNASTGIYTNGGEGNMIGCTQACQSFKANLIGGNGSQGIWLHKGSKHRVVGNRIGISYTGGDQISPINLGNGEQGLYVTESTDIKIGLAGHGNVFGFNGGLAIEVSPECINTTQVDNLVVN
ncbi:MAG: right-handed parallel beta-helix repeat-containing protein [Anaerolineae bacterium]|nr:right-handed parallel beta-helix repeat-containing protein [Anaerolineae bacterium]